ncbi:hypothetical protein FDP41_011818 [Naegleria fowleri]|uniref:Uncharacterized protein n=1 Tax=Naegleria fowleri TaxID=5763 RepID=A0A6A5BXG8_NAEFO|nr:uncharacterized protein FDP41_011818 [Naegleria fowleri]KAF0981957.1 hypothetical protein FDP41_011818 [Naegleria fowleri]
MASSTTSENLKDEISRLVTLKKQLKEKWNPRLYLSSRIRKIAKRFSISIPRKCKRRISWQTVEEIRKLAKCNTHHNRRRTDKRRQTPSSEKQTPRRPRPPRHRRPPSQPTTPTTPSQPENPSERPSQPSQPENPPTQTTPERPSRKPTPTTPSENPTTPETPMNPPEESTRPPSERPEVPTRKPSRRRPRLPRKPRRPSRKPRDLVFQESQEELHVFLVYQEYHLAHQEDHVCQEEHQEDHQEYHLAHQEEYHHQELHVARGDPHYVTLEGQDILFNGVGDFILAETLDQSLIAHVRISKWRGERGTATVNKAIAVKIGADIIEYSSSSGKFYLNKKRARFAIGKEYELDGGFLKRKTKNTFIVKSDDGVELFGEKFTLHDGRSYMDVQVDAPDHIEFSRGLIVDGKDGGRAANLFRTHQPRRVLEKEEIEIPKWAKKACAKRGLTGKKLKDCAYDATVTGREFAKEIAKDESKFNKKSDKVVKKAMIPKK